jgi:hypothetical protein
VSEKSSVVEDVSVAVITPAAGVPSADASRADAPRADAPHADATAIDIPNTSGVGCQKSNGLKHSTDVFEACKSITATNCRVAPYLLQKQVIVNESVALNLTSKVTTSSNFNKNNLSIPTTFEINVQDEIIIKSNDEKVDGNATSFQPIGLNEQVVKSFDSYKSMGLKLNYSCECVVHEMNKTCFHVVQLVQKVEMCFANGKTFDVADDAAVQFIALTATLVPGNLSGAADVVAVAAELRELNGLTTILVRISCCVFFYLFLLANKYFESTLGCVLKNDLMGKNDF